MPDPRTSPKRRKTNPTGKIVQDVITDPRFANIQSDPRYKLPSKKHTRVQVDKRFSRAFHDKDFSKSAAVDRYGRRLHRDDTKKQLEKFYRLDEDDVDREISVDRDEEIQKELRRISREDYDPARQGGFSESSSSEESSSDEESEVGETADEAEEAELPDRQPGDVPLGEVTERIAIVNLDWDNIRAEDLMAVFSSFLPVGGKILRVSVYPSEFGKERIEKEEMEGPPVNIFNKIDTQVELNPEDDDNEEGEEEKEEEEEEEIKRSILKEDEGHDFDSAQLRKYQLERLRYFYAILTCSSKETAKHIYDSVDGTEYMSSANFFDLRFVPEPTTFTDDIPRDECHRIPDGYKPNDFVTDALQHSKVKLTWDTDDRGRKAAQARAFRGSRKEIDENDLKAYLGSDSSDTEDEALKAANGAQEGDSSKLSKKDAERLKIRALLGLSKEPSVFEKNNGPIGDMEVTFSAGLTAHTPRDSVFENEPEKQETTKEKYIRKERERKQRRKAKSKAEKTGVTTKEDDGNSEQRSNDEKDLGFEDPFFTAPELDLAKVAAQRKEEKRKLRQQRDADEVASAAQRAELELLMVDDKVSNIKHFDMNEIERAQKRARKAGKRQKEKKNEITPADDFKIDVNDARFQRLFESHEYAIDPTNPRFKQTDGMKAVLEESRKRRRHVGETISNHEASEPKKKKQKEIAFTERDTDDLKQLVERVKGKAKRV
ncbi:pre-rRNA-processing protein esf1 [Ophidiomyces ophidiicola]|uniref:pre-rRNA-processing protein esf1 n=1 Tax=Ophidiomyces ophidiicola TaxID=1387563 RepID=UPI0020C4D26F|nr:pre-rRNA-processing protein esf1 [Ophidiomyces ophidiicola]KAI1937072.1 pre-rRNA-processing protein esf1 [Ophidiomyces ophidiicola]KAI2047194.1 pre-rRNA-processing protein esf1 [Ophidiomyces ophidiicola]